MNNITVTQLTETDVQKIVRKEIREALAEYLTNQNQQKILNVDEAATYLTISKSHLYKLTSRGEIPHSKQGKRIYFSKAELDVWLLENKVQGVTELTEEVNQYLNKKDTDDE